MKYLSPIFFIKSLVALITELRRFKKYINLTQELEKDGTLRSLGLRRTRYGSLYYVKNLQPEILLNAEELSEFEIFQIKESVSVYNEPMIKYGILDLVRTGYERIKSEDFYAYLIWIEFNKKEITLEKILYLVVYLLILLTVSGIAVFKYLL